MTKKTMMVLIALAFMCSALFLMTSCATQKEATVTEVTPPPTGPSDEEIQATRDAAKKAEDERKAQAEMRRAEAEARQAMQEFEETHIYFDFDKSELKPEARAVLVKKAEYLRKNPEYRLRIDGNCDERGTNEYNLALGDRRAHAALEFLATLGVSEARMDTISYGEERPLDPGHDEEAWAKNRNDQFKLLK